MHLCPLALFCCSDLSLLCSLGFFADSVEEFAHQLYLALTLSEQESLAMRQRARLSSKRFSVEAFEQGFGEVWKEVKEWIS
jgi:alpha-1,2-mannosyltransferase